MHEEVRSVFLGANEGKEFFLKHNSLSVKTIHNLADDVLEIIADGTYTRLEKRALVKNVN